MSNYKDKKAMKKLIFGNLTDLLLTIFILTVTTIVCTFITDISGESSFSLSIYTLAIFLIARFTKSYFYGIISSIVSISIYNYIVVTPHFQFSLEWPETALSITCMLLVSLVTSMLTSQIKLANQSKVEAEREKTRSNLLRAVSHDLRTPLTSISGISDTLIENYDQLSKEQQIAFLEDIKKDSEWLYRMVENLLSITRIENEGARVTKTIEAVEEVVPDALMKFKRHFPNHNVELQLPKELLLVPMDAMLIEQVIVNLLENSCVHAKGATKTILMVKSNSEYAEFSVIDNGCGLNVDEMEKMISGKHISENTNSDNEIYKGIGLSISRTIVKAHGGRMFVYNNEMGGATFSFTLPLTKIMV